MHWLVGLPTFVLFLALLALGFALAALIVARVATATDRVAAHLEGSFHPGNAQDKAPFKVQVSAGSRQAIMVPQSAVLQNETGRFVWLVGPDGKLYVSVGSSCNVCEDDKRRAHDARSSTTFLGNKHDGDVMHRLLGTSIARAAVSIVEVACDDGLELGALATPHRGPREDHRHRARDPIERALRCHDQRVHSRAAAAARGLPVDPVIFG